MECSETGSIITLCEYLYINQLEYRINVLL